MKDAPQKTPQNARDGRRRGTLSAPLFLLVMLSLTAVRPETARSCQSDVAIDVFRQFAPQVLKVEVLEAASSTPRSVGTAFIASSEGHLVTNYHVIIDLVYEPSRYHMRLVDQAGDEWAATIVAVDAADDLAILVADYEVEKTLSLSPMTLSQGARLFSLGHPADLSTAVVEGTYNGPVEHSISPRYHITGSINPGMSGGPTIIADGRVVGVNVSSAGDQLSFVVPIAKAVELLTKAQASPRSDAEGLMEQAADQLREFQEEFFSSVLPAPLPTTELGPYTVPTAPDSLFDCSADRLDTVESLYQGVEQSCFTSDHLWLSGTDSYSFINMEHLLLESTELNRFRFHALYSSWFQGVYYWEAPDNEETTDYRCKHGNVSIDGLRFRVAFCARQHTRLEGLYDVFIRSAVLGAASSGVASTLLMNGVSLENAKSMMGRFLGGFSWTG
jgi:serine protease Do